MFRIVADEYEALHPDVSIQFQQIASLGGEEEWIKTQLLGGIAPEIVSINTEMVWPDVDKGWWVSLEPYLQQANPYIPEATTWWDAFLNQPLSRAKRAPDGKMYCIPLDLVETGLIYNKDIFRKVGVDVPHSWAEFLDIQRRLADAGYIPMVMEANVAAADWAHDILFDMLHYEIVEQLDRVPSAEDARGYLTNYLFPNELCWNIRHGAFCTPRYREVWRLLYEWRQYWNKELINTDTVRLFLTQRGAIYWSGSWFVRRLLHDPYVNFDWGVFYLPPITRESSAYAVGVDAAVIGGAAIQLSVTNRAVLDGEEEIAVDFLRYLTAPRNVSRVVGEAAVFFPNIRGATMAPGLEPFAEIIKRRYCTVKWVYSLTPQFNDAFRRLVPLYLNDGISLDRMMAEVDRLMQDAAQSLFDQAQKRAVEKARTKAQEEGKTWDATAEQAFRARWTWDTWLAEGP